MNRSDYILAIDMGGTFFKYAVVNIHGEMVTNIKKAYVNSAGSLEDIMNAYQSIIFPAFESGYALSGIGVSTPGPFDYADGMSFMKHKFQCIYGISLRNEIIKNCSLDIPVWFCSDANAFLMGEYCFGTGKGFQNVFGVTIGTGIGFAIIQDRCLLTNGKGGPREVIYNYPCEGGILEDIVSGRGVVNTYNRLTNRDNTGISAKDIEHLAMEKQDEKAVLAYSMVGFALGNGIKALVDKYNAECLIVGGQVANAFDLMKKGILDGIDSDKINVASAFDIDGAALKGVVRLRN